MRVRFTQGVPKAAFNKAAFIFILFCGKIVLNSYLLGGFAVNDVCVSIIMPVYNVERYLHSSVNDVLSQTYRNFELILVDDASPDNCGFLCDSFTKKDARVRVLHLPVNKGVWNARNEGLKVAKGKYILFLDSDDRISPNLISLCVKSMDENPCDVVVFGLIEEHFDKSGQIYATKTISLKEKVLKSSKEVQNEVVLLEKSGLYGYPWNKLFSAEILKKSGAKFPEMKFNEDIIFNICVFNFTERCNILSATPYRYAKRSSSTTGKFISTYYDDIMVKIDHLYEQFTTWRLGDNAFHLIADRYVRYFFSALERNFDRRSLFTKKSRKAFFKNELTHPRYKALSPYMKGSGISGIMAKFFKSKNLFFCMLIARIIYLTKKLFPKIFEKIS